MFVEFQCMVENNETSNYCVSGCKLAPRLTRPDVVVRPLGEHERRMSRQSSAAPSRRRQESGRCGVPAPPSLLSARCALSSALFPSSPDLSLSLSHTHTHTHTQMNAAAG